MKKAFTNWKNYLIALILVIIALLFAFIPAYAVRYSWFGVVNWDWIPEYPILFCAALFVLIGFVWQDLHKANYRRKVKNWDKELPQNIKDEGWARCCALFVAAAGCALVDLILLIIVVAQGIDSVYYML